MGRRGGGARWAGRPPSAALSPPRPAQASGSRGSLAKHAGAPPPPQRRPHFPTPVARADADGPGLRQDAGRGARGAGYWRGMRAQGAGGPVSLYPAQSFPSAARGQPGRVPKSSLSPLATPLPSLKVGLGVRAAPGVTQAGAPAHRFSSGRKLWPGAHPSALTP